MAAKKTKPQEKKVEKVKVKLTQYASGKPYYLANKIGDEIQVTKEKAIGLITDELAVPVGKFDIEAAKKEMAEKKNPAIEKRG